MGANEQQRIAMMRELHDAVTHSQSSIALQTMVAEGSTDPELLHRCLSNIQLLNRESVIQLRLLERLLRDAADAHPLGALDVPGRRAPTAVAAEWQRQFMRGGAAIEISVPLEADQIEVTVRNTLAAALDAFGEYLQGSLPAGDRSTIVAIVEPEQVQLVFTAVSSARRSLPPMSGIAWHNLQARTVVVGGEIICSDKVSTMDQSWRIELRLKSPL